MRSLPLHFKLKVAANGHRPVTAPQHFYFAQNLTM
jgi:hypothetical protein